jgi:hypothetical protein
LVGEQMVVDTYFSPLPVDVDTGQSIFQEFYSAELVVLLT